MELDRRDGRAVDCTGLENRRTFAGLGGSNPSLSATISTKHYRNKMIKFLFISILFHSFPVHSALKRYEFDINIKKVNFTGEEVLALAVGNQIPAPLIEARVGDTLEVTFNNKMKQESSIHWHGVLLPNDQDGVPYLTTKPIAPHSSFTYKFRVRHSGTYWYHSHTGLQEQRGVYGPLIFHPTGWKKNRTNQDQTLVFSDWINENPEQVLANIKKEDDYYALKKGSVISWFGILKNGPLAIKNHLINSFFRMGGMDISDVGYDAFLANGKKQSFLKVTPQQTVRLRLINASASTYFNVEFSGKPMKIISADGMNIKPIRVKRLLMAIAETYDVVVYIPDRKIYEMRATSRDGTGYSSFFIGSGSKKVFAPKIPKPNLYLKSHHEAHKMTSRKKKSQVMKYMKDYRALQSLKQTHFPKRKPKRKVILNLTGNMEKYVWGFNKKTLLESDKIFIKKGEVVQFVLNNHTMMDHPIHLHGHFFRVLNGQGRKSPLKHTVNVPSMDQIVIEFSADKEKDWFFHCHNLYHMKAGMSRVVSYKKTSASRPDLFKKLAKDPFYFSGELSFLSQMTVGHLNFSSARNAFKLEYDFNYKKQYETELNYAYSFTSFFDIYVGVEMAREKNQKSEKIGVVGFRYKLPFLIESEFRVDSERNFRVSLESDLQLTTRNNLEWSYNTDNEYRISLSYELNKKAVFIMSYDSDFEWGAGMQFRF